MTPAVVVVVVAAVGATTRIDLAPWIGLLLGGGFGSIATGWVVLHKAKSDREKTRADTADTLTHATEKWSEYVDGKMDELLDENRRLREKDLAQRAEIAAANAATAAAEAAAARAEAERSTERHGLQNEITARETQIALLQRTIAELQAEIAQLRAGTPSRRAGDLN